MALNVEPCHIYAERTRLREEKEIEGEGKRRLRFIDVLDGFGHRQKKIAADMKSSRRLVQILDASPFMFKTNHQRR